MKSLTFSICFFYCIVAFNQQPKRFLSNKINTDKSIYYSLRAEDSIDNIIEIDVDNPESYYKNLITTYDSICCSLKKKCDATYQSQLLKNVLEVTKNIESLDAINLNELLLEQEEKHKATLDVINKIDKLTKSLKYKVRTENKFSFMPVRNEQDLMTYDNFNQKDNDKFMNETKLMFQPDDQFVSLYSELYKDYFGVVRIGIGTVLNASSGFETDTEEEIPFDEDGVFEEIETVNSRAINKLSSGGGLLVLKASLPLLLYTNKDRNFNFKTEFQNRIGIDLPNVGGTSSKYSMNSEFNIYNKIYFGGWTNEIAIIGEARFGYINGNETFFNQIDNENSTSFFMHQFSIGLVLDNKFQLSWNIMKGDDFIEENAKSLLSFSMVME